MSKRMHRNSHNGKTPTSTIAEIRTREMTKRTSPLPAWMQDKSLLPRKPPPRRRDP